jgi:Transglycosylase SLT domain
LVDLAVPKPELVTAEAPTNRVGGDAFSRTPEAGIGGGLANLGGGLEDVATSLAKKEGEQAARQAVTLDANGQVQVQTPQTSPIVVGKAGQAYDRAVADGIDPAERLAIGQQFTQMRQAYETDPNAKPEDWLKTTADFAQKWKADHPGPLGDLGYDTALRVGNAHYAGIMDAATKQDVANSKAAITTELQTAQNTLYSIARQGGTSTPEYQDALGRWNSAWDKLAANGEMFGIAPASVAQQRKDAQIELIGQGLYGSIDRTVKDPGPNGGIAGAEKIARSIPSDPRFRELSQAEQTRLQTMVEARVQFNREENKALIDGNAAAARAIIDGYGKGQAPTPEQFQAIHDNAVRLGDVDSVAQLNAYRQAYETRRPLVGLGAGAGAPQGVASADTLHRAIVLQESGGNPNVATSVDGARGIGQITPDTFAQYAKPGEKIDSPADNLAVSKRIIGDYYQRYNGDAARVAVAYFSGPGNVAPAGSATPWKEDRADGNGKTTSSYVADVLHRANGGTSPIPFTAGQVAQNPYLVAAAYKQYDADKAGQVEVARQLTTGLGNMMRNGITPSVPQMAQAYQAGQQFPRELGNTVNDLMTQYAGHTGGASSAVLPDGEGEARRSAVETYVRNNPSIAGANYLKAFNDQFNADRKRQSEEPQQYAASVGWRDRAPPPLTPEDPQAFAAQISDRVAGAHFIASRLGQAPEQVTFGNQDKADIAGFLQRAPGPQAKAAMQTLIGGLNTATANELFRDKDTSKAIIAMSKSDDPDKIDAGFQAMDAQYRRDPAQFDAQFPKESARLHDWQSRLSYYSPSEIAKQNLKANDPSQTAAITAKENTAKEATKLWTAESVAKQFGTGIVSYIPGVRGLVGAIPDTPPEFDNAKGAFLADAQMLYRDGFVQSGDTSQATAYMTERLANKYSVSDVNGNRVMAYAPEKRFQPINGSHDWIKQQLGEFVQKNVVPAAGSMGVMMPLAETIGGGEGTMAYYPRTTEEQTAYAKNYAPRMLFADQDTQADIAAGRPPSYAVIAADPNGRTVPLTDTALKPLRFTPDYGRALGEWNAVQMGKQPVAQRANAAAEPYFGGGG